MYGIVCAYGDPMNFVLMADWDGFQSVRTRQRDCRTLELYVINGGEDLHPCVFFKLFIPINFVKYIEYNSGMILKACLKPFITELEKLFVNGFRTLFFV